MAPPSRTRALPQALTSPMLGELFAAELETLLDPPTHGEHDGQAAAGFDATPTARARRRMLTGFITELRAYHDGDDT